MRALRGGRAGCATPAPVRSAHARGPVYVAVYIYEKIKQILYYYYVRYVLEFELAGSGDRYGEGGENE